MAAESDSQRIHHPIWGEGTLLRVEGTDWIVQFDNFGRAIRLPVEGRYFLRVTVTPSPTATETIPPPNGKTVPPLAVSSDNATSPKPTSSWPPLIPPTRPVTSSKPTESRKSPEPASSSSPASPTSAQATKADVVPSPKASALPPELNGLNNTWHMRRAIESLANGLPPSTGLARYLAIDFDVTNRLINYFLNEVSEDGGAALSVRGSYGQGKTFTLNCLEDVALSRGFLVMRVEADAKENRLNRPDQVYRNLMKSLRIPGHEERGAHQLVKAVTTFLKSTVPNSHPQTYRKWLDGKIGCHHLEWLFSDPSIHSNEQLIGLLANSPGVSATSARASHYFRGIPRNWTALSDGTLGDFASFLLSGIGRLARLIGKQGLIIIVDEMEKWQELKWLEQSRASSFICGMIWAATKSEDRKVESIQGLNNNRRFPSPFSTVERCSLGLAVAMTPRGDDEDPQLDWAKYGPITSVDLPQLSPKTIRDYCQRVAPVFSVAFETSPPNSAELQTISLEAIETWKTYGEKTNRAAVQSVVAAFQNWREQTMYSQPARA